MSMVVEPLVSILVDKGLSDITSFLRSKTCRKRKIIAEISRWKTTLEDLRGVLRDADSKKQSNTEIRTWLEELEDLMYDVEDVIEVFNYQILQHQVESSVLSKIRTGLIWHNSELHGMLKGLTKRFQRLKDRKSILNLFEVIASSSIMLQPSRQTRDPSGPLRTEPVIFGRDYYKQEIIRMLKEEGKSRIGVVSIIGMGGLGKTTLARYVYHDKDIVSYFEIRGWVCVSSDYDTKRITKDILESVSGNCGDIKDKALGWIQDRLGQELRNKKFLIVLDDNWNENYGDWQTLKAPFNEGLRGSKIIVTTRRKNIAMKVSPGFCIEPNLLSDNDAWSLFCIHANLVPNGTSIFEETGKEIAKKCCGLPLAAMTVGGMLRDKLRVEEWEDICKNMTWALEDVNQVLRMSYDDLTPQLKRCFDFLCLFPEVTYFTEEDVVSFWIGAGLILSLTGQKSKKEVAHDCFHKLLSRCLFSPVGWLSKYHKYFRIHDLLRELVKQASSRKTLCIDNDNDELMIKSARHLYVKDGLGFEKIVESITKGGKVTSLPLRSMYNFGAFFSTPRLSKQIGEIFLRLKYIRGCDLHMLDIAKLPKSVGQMKLLRYFCLSSRKIKTLPTSLTTLYNLEILILRGCQQLKQLPEKIDKLIHLWYLDVSYCPCLKKLPLGIKELKRLEKLPRFIVDDNLSVASLANWKLSQESLEIFGLENVASPEDATLARLSEKRLDKLSLFWTNSLSDDPTRENQSQILEKLQPHRDLKELKIMNGRGQMFPSWLSSSCGYLTVLELDCESMEVHLPGIPNLTTLCLKHCSYVNCTDTFDAKKLDTLILSTLAMSDLFKKKVMLGCPNIRYLHIEDLDCSLADIMADNYDEEMKVEELHVTRESNIEHLPQWVSKAKFLKRIVVKECSFLKELLPNGDIPPSLEKIEINDCHRLISILSQDPFPETAKSLRSMCVRRCSSLKILLPANDMFMEDCILLESFHEGGSQSPSIKWLSINNCPLLLQKLQDKDEKLCSKISLQYRWVLFSRSPFIEVDGNNFINIIH